MDLKNSQKAVSLNDENGRKLPISDENGILKCPIYLQTFTYTF